MRKNFISAICALTMIISGFSAVAQETEPAGDTQVIAALKALNLLTEEKKITHDSFIYSLAGFLYENPREMGLAEELALQTGMLEPTKEYKGDKIITFDEAIEYAVVTLGYKSKAKLMGDDGYKNVASELGIAKGVTASGDDIILLEDAAKILDNMLDIAPMVAYYKNEAEMGYTIETEETLLSLNRGIYEITGLLTANEITSLYREEGAAKDCVRIGENEYSVSEACNVDFLGRNIVAYMQEDNYGDTTVIHIKEKENKNEILTIAADDIEYVADDFSVIEYLESETKLGKAKLAAVPRIIYNGVYYDGYTAEDLSPDVGEITFIDNNMDGKYDVLNVTSYQTVVVESLDSIDSVIYNRYKFDGCIEKIELDEENSDFAIYDAGGVKTEFMSLKIGDILSVLMSKNTDDRQIRIYISGKEKAAVKVTSVDYDEMKIAAGENEYKMTEEFSSYINNVGKSTSVGEEYIFYFDVFGNIVYMENAIDMEYNLFYKMYEEDEKYYVVYMDINNTWKTSPFAKRVKNEDSKYDADKLYEMFTELSPQVVRLKENSNGEITKFEIATLMGYSEDKFTKTAETSYQYLLNPNSFAMKLYLEDDAKLFVFPGEGGSKEDYYVRNASGFFTADKSYKITAYDQDEYGFCPVFTIVDTEANQQERANQGMFIITSIFQKELDGDVVSVVKGNFGQYKNLTLVGNTSDIYDGLQAGDIINVGMNAKGRVNYVKKILSLNSFEASDPLSYYKNSAIVAGTIESMDIEKKRFKINCGSSVSLRLPTDSSVQIYTRQNRKCEMKNASELHVGDKVVCRLSYGTVSEIACVREM